MALAKFDTGKPVLIVGKGPSARRVEAQDDCYVAALNEAAHLCEHVDALFVNDVSALNAIHTDALATADVIVLPTCLHLTTDGKQLKRWMDALSNCPQTPPQIFLYQLHTVRPHEWMTQLCPFFGVIRSVGETAVAWLLWHGFREFATLGIDPEGGYSEHFDGGPQVKKPKRWFEDNWHRINKRVDEAGGTLTRTR